MCGLSFRARAVAPAIHTGAATVDSGLASCRRVLEYRGGLYAGRVSLFGRGFALAQDGPKLALERRKRCHQRSGFELSGAANAVGEVIGWIVRKMRQVCFSIQHVRAPSRALAVLLHRSAVVKVGLIPRGIHGVSASFTGSLNPLFACTFPFNLIKIR